MNKGESSQPENPFPRLAPGERPKAALMVFLSSLFWLIPGAIVLATHEWGAPDHATPGWVVALIGIPFCLFGLFLIVLAFHVKRGTAWRGTAFVFILLVCPCMTGIAAWPLVAGAPSFVESVIAAILAFGFGLPSAVLWWLALTRRITAQDVRGLTEDEDLDPPVSV